LAGPMRGLRPCDAAHLSYTLAQLPRQNWTHQDGCASLHANACFRVLLSIQRFIGLHQLTSKSPPDRFLTRHKITRRKKSLRAVEQRREDVARARSEWIREQGLFDLAKLVFYRRNKREYQYGTALRLHASSAGRSGLPRLRQPAARATSSIYSATG
jgi:hypothetical protein